MKWFAEEDFKKLIKEHLWILSFTVEGIPAF